LRPDITLAVYRILVNYSTKFDRLTKTKTVEGLLPLIPEDEMDDILSFLMEAFLNQGNADRKWFADQLVVVFRQRWTSLQGRKRKIKPTIQFLCKHGFFKNPSLTASDQSVLRERLFSLLSILISDPKTVWPSYAVSEIENLDEKLIVKLDSKIRKIRKSGLKMMKKLGSLVCLLIFFLTQLAAKNEPITAISCIGNDVRIDVVAVVCWRY